MMSIRPAVSTEIGSIIKKDNSLLLTSPAGILRLQPLTAESVRISYTESDFREGQGCLLLPVKFEGWDYEVNASAVILHLPQRTITVDRKTGSVYAFSEAEAELKRPVSFHTSGTLPFQVEPFDFYRTSRKSEIRTEQIETPDGVKSRIVGRETEFDETLCRTRVNFRFEEGEHIIGLGQSEDGLYDFRGTTQYLHQANRKIAIPFFISSNGYGFLSTTESPSIFNDTAAGSYFLTEADEYLDFVLLLGGTPKEIIREYRAITGKASLLPKWAFGYVQSMERYETQEEIQKTAEEFEKRGLPLDLIVLDWESWEQGLWGQKSFDPARFPDPAEMVNRLHGGHVHFMMSIWPNMSSSCENYREMKANDCILPGTEIYDAFSERGRALYNKQLLELAKYGVDSWWCDSSEPCTPEWSRKIAPDESSMYHSYIGECSACMPLKKANAYGRYHAEGMYEGLRAYRKDSRVVNLTRNGYVGSQQHGTILWSGDTSASWETLRKQIAAGLNFVVTGHPYWTLDIGAFFVKYATAWFWNGDYPDGLNDPAFRELYVRWFEYGVFLPVFRAHGTDVRREPWAFEYPDDPCYSALKKNMELRYRLLPYIYSLAGACRTEDGSMMMPVSAEFPEDRRAWTVEEQFMFGPEIMVCPIVKSGDTGLFTEASRAVYFPEGMDWYELETMEKYEGGSEVMVSVPIDRIPVFVKAGSIVPVQKPRLHTEDQTGEDIELLVYPGADGAFRLYEDAGEGYGYEGGGFALTEICHEKESGELQIRTTGDGRFREGRLIPVFLKEDGE